MSSKTSPRPMSAQTEIKCHQINNDTDHHFPTTYYRSPVTSFRYQFLITNYQQRPTINHQRITTILPHKQHPHEITSHPLHRLGVPPHNKPPSNPSIASSTPTQHSKKESIPSKPPRPGSTNTITSWPIISQRLISTT
jgi:hypothetical protein